MSTSHHRLPRAGIDRIADEQTALATMVAAMHEPARAETIALLLDDDRRGRAIVVVSGTYHADAVIEVFECLAHTVEGLSALVIATVRPPRRVDLITDVCATDAATEDATRSPPAAAAGRPLDASGGRATTVRPASHPARTAGRVDDIRAGRHRPSRRCPGQDRSGRDRTDIDRWLEMSELADQRGVELVEWFVIGQQIACPRDAFGERPRW